MHIQGLCGGSLAGDVVAEDASIAKDGQIYESLSKLLDYINIVAV